MAAAMTGAYALAVIRVGGDFMHARLLVPVTPLLLVCAEHVIGRLSLPRLGPGLGQALVTAAAAAALLLTPSPVSGSKAKQGVLDERDFYLNVRPDLGEGHRTMGEALRPYFAGLPITAVYVGSEARTVYYSRVATAIEAETGLTDRFIAHQKIAGRGRPGHEKNAPMTYLVDERKAHLALRPRGVDPEIPRVLVDLAGHELQLLRWDPRIVAALRARGAKSPDVPAQLDAYLARADEIAPEQLAADYARFRRFYLEPAKDAAREAAFVSRLERLAARPR